MPSSYADLPGDVLHNVMYITSLSQFLTDLLNEWQNTRMHPADIADYQNAARDNVTSATALLPHHVYAQPPRQQMDYIDNHLIIADQALVQQMGVFIDSLEHQNNTPLAGEGAQQVRKTFVGLFANRGQANPFDEMHEWLHEISQDNLTFDNVEDTMHVISYMAAAMDGNPHALNRIAQRMRPQRTFDNPGIMAGYFRDSDSEPDNQDLNNQPQGPFTGAAAQGQSQGASLV